MTSTKIKYDNNHYELILQNNSNKKIYLIDDTNNISNSDLYLKFNIDTTKEYLILNNYTENVNNYSILESGEYTYCVFWNTLDISYVDFNTNDILDSIIGINYYNDNDEIEYTEKFSIKDLHPDMGLAKIDVPDIENKYSELERSDIYHSL